MVGHLLEQKAGIRVPMPFFRRVSGASYLRGYRSVQTLDATTLSRWVVVRAVEHLAVVLSLGSETERRDLQVRVEALVATIWPSPE